MASSSARYRPPFTATQWQELEHQALIFKYMSVGVHIPPDLLYTFNTSLDSRFLAQQPIEWNGCFQTGFGRKVDTEPGRCRRTDGKKWRCSKEAHQDSKYCEKHMHRGKARSRKPVEVSTSSSTTTKPNFLPYGINTQLYSSSPKPFGLSLSSQKNNTHHMFMDSGNSCSQDDIYIRGMNERSFTQEASGSARNYMPDSYEPLTMSSYYSESELPTGNSSQLQQQSCFVWGTDFKSSTKDVKAEKEDGSRKSLHQFLGEWPHKDT